MNLRVYQFYHGSHSFGIPVIASNVGGTSEIVNNENGILLSSNPSKQEVCTAINSFYSLTSFEKNNKKLLAYETWNEKYRLEKNYNKFFEAIDSL